MSSLIVYFPTPTGTSYHFHANHWYHMGEYFLSNYNSTISLIRPHLMEGITSLVVLADGLTLHQMITPMAFFVLLLSMWSPQLSSIQLMKPSQWKPVAVGSDTVVHGIITGNFSLDRALEDRFLIHNIDGKSQTITSERGKLLSFEGILHGKYIGNLVNKPHVASYWLAHPQDGDQLRARIQQICNSDNKNNTTMLHAHHSHNPERKFRLLIYQRDLIRKWLNIPTFLQWINQSAILSPYWTVDILMHTEQLLPCELYAQLQRTDVLLTTHGFQMTAISFLRAHSTVIEIYPFKYFKPTYFSLAKQLKIHHYWFQSSRSTSRYLENISLQRCMEDKSCRSFARNQDLLLDEREINALYHVLLGITKDKLRRK